MCLGPEKRNSIVFGEEGKDTEYPQLRESKWLSELAFAIDLFKHMKEIKTKLPGNDIFAHATYSPVKEFQCELKLFSRNLSLNITTHFPTLETMAAQFTLTEKYTNMITSLDKEITLHFGGFQKLYAEFDILS
ncbi:General transcription factor II-I repeat domain-containing protein 2 [Thelohanellus kitauei]|uniref:General transcription factor II-I repeat domain-containing protein 2 n=1 Tax=Thelohanellus kitauei TaxID=669202 RepID=A0A0C2IGB6_THEKT|nr:General transcription factor II-I repeat domain-containing protein 2 [Thelohanellus kitauei]